MPLESGWKDSTFYAQSLFLEFHGGEPSCWKFVPTSFDIVVQGRHAFKFNQVWSSAELLSTVTSTTSMLYVECNSSFFAFIYI